MTTSPGVRRKLRNWVLGWPAVRGGARSLSALLDVRPHEIFGVFLEHVVDLVQQIVGFLGQLLAALLPGGRVAGEVVVIAAATATLGLLLSHRCLLHRSSAACRPPVSLPYRSELRLLGEHHAVVSWSTSSAAVCTDSKSAPTCALLPRSGSRVGMRTSESPPR